MWLLVGILDYYLLFFNKCHQIRVFWDLKKRSHQKIVLSFFFEQKKIVLSLSIGIDNKFRTGIDEQPIIVFISVE